MKFSLGIFAALAFLLLSGCSGAHTSFNKPADIEVQVKVEGAAIGSRVLADITYGIPAPVDLQPAADSAVYAPPAPVEMPAVTWAAPAPTQTRTLHLPVSDVFESSPAPPPAQVQNAYERWSRHLLKVGLVFAVVFIALALSALVMRLVERFWFGVKGATLTHPRQDALDVAFFCGVFCVSVSVALSGCSDEYGLRFPGTRNVDVAPAEPVASTAPAPDPAFNFKIPSANVESYMYDSMSASARDAQRILDRQDGLTDDSRERLRAIVRRHSDLYHLK
jgi:hypothetical protein